MKMWVNLFLTYLAYASSEERKRDETNTAMDNFDKHGLSCRLWVWVKLILS